MEMVRHDYPHGATTIFLSEEAASAFGIGPTCSPFVAAIPGHPLILAHEIGHTLGLGHVDTEGNLMRPSSNGPDLTTEQIDHAREGSWRIQQCDR